jgi:hypothetical protein
LEIAFHPNVKPEGEQPRWIRLSSWSSCSSYFKEEGIVRSRDLFDRFRDRGLSERGIPGLQEPGSLSFQLKARIGEIGRECRAPLEESTLSREEFSFLKYRLPGLSDGSHPGTSHPDPQ